MFTRRSWRNQERAYKQQSADLQRLADAGNPAKQPPPILTDEEIDAMWWIPKQSRRMLKIDMTKRRKGKVAV